MDKTSAFGGQLSAKISSGFPAQTNSRKPKFFYSKMTLLKKPNAEYDARVGNRKTCTGLQKLMDKTSAFCGQLSAKISSGFPAQTNSRKPKFFIQKMTLLKKLKAEYDAMVGNRKPALDYRN